MIAAPEVSAERFRAAGKDVGNGAPVRRQDRCVMSVRANRDLCPGRRREYPRSLLPASEAGCYGGAVQSNKCYATFTQSADAMLSFLRDEVPRNWAILRDSVTDNFHVISPNDFRVMA
jgi:hypothetical protein